ncbi:MAG: KilA-N domain-containing protein [Candidatus Gracilibacteria bacterium]|nr:KilA-N domain-containing protein [Candidatus Gracilibacteria bacterium]
MKKIIQVNGKGITLFEQKQEDFISLTDIAKYKNIDFPADVVKNWLRTRNTIEYLGIWEKINNPNFKLVDFDQFRENAGSNSFVMTPTKWIENTKAIGIISKPGKTGGTFAHKDIAFKFASWISPEFELYVIKEFQRLKQEEEQRKIEGWDIKRTIASINYKIQTDAIQKHLIPTLSEFKQKFAYANEADLLNLVIWGKTAKIWENENPELAKNGNMRDYTNVIDLVILANLENFNAEFIKKGLSKEERFEKLLEIAKTQKQALLHKNNESNIKKLESGE